MRRCICVEKKNQLDATEWFTAMLSLLDVNENVRISRHRDRRLVSLPDIHTECKVKSKE